MGIVSSEAGTGYLAVVVLIRRGLAKIYRVVVVVEGKVGEGKGSEYYIVWLPPTLP